MSRKRDRGPDPGAPAGGPWLDPEEAEPKLIVFARPDPDGIPAELEAALATGAVAALAVGAEGLPAAALARWRAVCHGHAAAFLVQGDAAAARDRGADGVHLDDPNRVAAARGLLGAEGLIGASCRLSRHAAMVAGEAGADYLLVGSLDQEPEADGEVAGFVAWWSDLFVIPCAAAGRLTPEVALSLARAGADLLAVRDGGPDESRNLLDLARALKAARPQPKIGRT